ncbi:hypothetical protein G7Y41_07130 [Schaalia sp. ZJ405]|uniref:hypothetical protein n=1 Tax=Schaalia sp. ZJ405 TaxID=2709403 RepID=UPI0013EAE4C2|nr:hypothetical protein [Schaalia sp. ZJ405]QPK80826.1 hypothetical protein G7Y41_07130 [Schaalia sp. ZJ405]
MALDVFRTIDVEISTANDYVPPIRLSGGDHNGRYLRVKLWNGSSPAQSTGLTARLLFNPCDGSSGGYVTMTAVSGQETACWQAPIPTEALTGTSARLAVQIVQGQDLLCTRVIEASIDSPIIRTDAQPARNALSEFFDAVDRVGNVTENAQTAEAARAKAEAKRVEEENRRASAESGRVNAENQRISAENNRGFNETSRTNAETQRALAETARESAEAQRREAESEREKKEKSRASTEAARATAERLRDEQQARNNADQVKNNRDAKDIQAKIIQECKNHFAPLSHQHSAGDITSGTLPVSRGGLGIESPMEARAARQSIGAASQEELEDLRNSLGSGESTPWETLPLGDGWAPINGQTPRIRKVNGLVCIDGVVMQAGGGVVAYVATIPPAYLPSSGEQVIGVTLTRATFDSSLSKNMNIVISAESGNLFLDEPTSTEFGIGWAIPLTATYAPR